MISKQFTSLVSKLENSSTILYFMVRHLSGGNEYGWYAEGLEILCHPYEGYTPIKANTILDMWNKYSDMIHEV